MGIENCSAIRKFFFESDTKQEADNKGGCHKGMIAYGVSITRLIIPVEPAKFSCH